MQDISIFIHTCMGACSMELAYNIYTWCINEKGLDNIHVCVCIYNPKSQELTRDSEDIIMAILDIIPNNID